MAIINKELNILLPEEEIVNIAYHFINCQEENSKNKIREAKLVGHIVNIVRFSISKQIDITDIHYLRFITHIKFFVKRFFDNNMLKGDSFNLTKYNKKNIKKSM